MKKVYKRVVQRTLTQQQSNNNDAPHPFLQHLPTSQANASIYQFPNQSKIQQKHQQNHPQVKVQHKINNDPEPNQPAKDRPDNVKKIIADQISISPNSHLKSQNIPSQLATNTNITSQKNEVKPSEEERKSKIEQLKQKYLKKGNTQAKTEISKPNDLKRQAVQQQAAPQLTIPAKVESQQQQQVKQIVLNRPKQQKKEAEFEQVIVKIQQKPQQQHKQVVNKVFKPPIPNTVPRPKLAPTKPKQQQTNDAQAKEVKQPIKEKEEQPAIIKSNTKITYPPPPKIKNTGKYPPALIPKHVEQQEIIPNTEKQTINQVKVAQLPHYYQEPSVIQPFKPQNKQNQHLISISHKAEEIPQLGIQQEIRLWLQNPSKLLSRIIPNIEQLSNIGLESNFTFASKNPQFNVALSDFLVEFVLKNKNILNQGQKAALYNFALQYFVGGNQLSAQLMLILIKLGAPYLAKHSVEIKRSLQSSCQIIAFKKGLFSNEELNTVVNFMTEAKELSEKELLYLLLIYPSERLLTLLSNKPFNNVSNILALLCFINFKKEFTNLMILYLKLINLLIDNMPQNTSLGQKILKHLNQLQTNDKSYQIHKQIKLKLITIVSKSQQAEVKPMKSQVKQQKSDGGLVGYWTKAVDKIKTATTQLVDLKELPKPAPKQQEKEEDIVYDPVLKRYLINGKVPDDENQRPKDNPSSKAPPPPKQSNKPVPPPLPVKKAKVVTNRYA